VTDVAMLQLTLDRLVDSVCRGLDEEGRVGRTVTLKIRLRPFRTHTRSRTLEDATSDSERIRAVAGRLLDEFGLDAPVRLLGVGVSGLARSSQGPAHAPDGEPTGQGALALDL
jgi:DNA polymerase-4